MTTSIPRSVPGFGGAASLSDVYTSAAKSLLANNPGIKTIDAQLSRDQARLSAIGKLALALDDFRTSANKLTGDKLDLAASVGGQGFSAELKDAKAAVGTHAVEVKQLAAGQQLATLALPDKGAALGLGGPATIKIDSGTGSTAKSTTLRIDNSNNTLDGIAKAMRDAGLDAKVVQDGKGYSLSLNGAPGTANTMRISVAGDAALQALLAYGPGFNSTVTQKSPAQDAQVTVDGKALTVPSNELDNAIPGVAIKLTAVGKGEVKVASDPAAMAGNVKSFVNAMNTLSGKLDEQQAADPAGSSASNAMASQIRKQFDKVFSGGNEQSLAALGIVRRGGKLVLDEAKLKTAIAADPAKVTTLFGGGENGLAAQLSARATQLLGTQGVLATQAAAVKGEVDKLTAQKTQVTEAVQRQASTLVRQYALVGAGVSPTMSLFDFMG